jgi:hypothetical protein
MSVVWGGQQGEEFLGRLVWKTLCRDEDSRGEAGMGVEIRR